MRTYRAYPGKAPRENRQVLWAVWVIAVTLALLCGCAASTTASSGQPGGGGGGGGKGKGGRRGGGGGDVPVTVAQVALKNVPVEVQVIGNVEALSTISVRAQVGGQLMQVHFKEGDYVKKGDLLFEIDPRPLEAALHQSEANLARDQATIGQAQANLAKDEAQARYLAAQAERYSQLFQNGIISRDQAEQVRANADAIAQGVTADRATIESTRANLGATQAAVENARVQLGFTKIYSPIDGRTGNLTVKQGNVVQATVMELVTILQVQPIYVTFSVPESQLPATKRYMDQHTLQVRAKPQDDATADEDIGDLTFVDNTVDVTTGTIKLKGTFPNKDRRLWPGQFVRVTLRLTTQTGAIVVPNQAVQTGQSGPYIYVVKADHTVESRPVVTGARVDQDMVIEKGIVAGETVVTEGQLRLAPGSRVILPGERPGRGGGGRGKKG